MTSFDRPGTILAAVFLAGLLAGPSEAEVVRLGRGSFSTSLPSGAKGPEALNLFAAHAFAFVTDTQVSWTYDEPSATLTTRFAATTRPRQGTERRPILALYRHQWLNLGGGPAREWRDLIWMAQALVDPQAALAAINADPDYRETSGLSKAHTYHWIARLARLGPVRPDVTADSPTAAAFGRDGQTRHVAWNPSRRDQTVTFSDGARLVVPAGAVVSDDGGR